MSFLENKDDKNRPALGYGFNTVNHWMVKAKSGETAQDLFESAREYFQWCEQNPIYGEEVVRQTGQRVPSINPRVFNLPALCIHCGVTESYIMDMAHNKNAGEFHQVAGWILRVIYSQNLEYATVGLFNANIISKKLMLGTQEESSNAPTTVNVTVIKNDGVPELENSEFENENEIPDDEI